MKLGPHLFKKTRSIWGTPLIAYDPERMDQVFPVIPTAEAAATPVLQPEATAHAISLETELYLMLNS